MSYNAFALCEPGLEDISAQEIRELIGKKGTQKEGVILFSANSEELALLCYKAQSLRRVASLLCSFTFNSLEDVHREIERIDFSSHIKKQASFAVSCERVGEHDFRSVDVEQAASAIISKTGKKDFENPDARFFIYVNGKNCYVGVDFAGFDLAQRDYKVFAHAASLKGTIAYAVARLGGVAKEKHIVCFSMKSGMVSIEAALYLSGKSVNHYRKDKFAFCKFLQFDFMKHDREGSCNIRELNHDQRDLGAARKNAKIAGVEKLMAFTHADVDWLDVKFKEGEIDMLFTQPVAGESKKMKEFLHQAAYVVAKDGKVVTVSAKDDFKDVAKEFGFVVKEERTLKRGNGIVKIQVFEKN